MNGLLRRQAADAVVALVLSALVECTVVIAQSQPAQSTGVRPKASAETEAGSGAGEDALTQRVCELVYLLRQHRVFSRSDEWAGAIRELVEIGKPAVPELVAELDRTDRDQTLRALGFTLRAIGDPRAVPALIRAIPKTLRARGSDCGIFLLDADLRAFMKKHDRHDDEGTSIAHYGRPVNEILGALEKITGHRQPRAGRDELRHLFLGGSPEKQAASEWLFHRRMEHWQTWWSEHWQDFVTKEELESVELPRRGEDPVAQAGLARFGPLFPTGGRVRLGPVREVELGPEEDGNATSHVDFDTGRVYGQPKITGGVAPENAYDFAARTVTWYQRMGIDARYQGGIVGRDLHLWLVEDNRWNTLEEEIRSGRPIKLGLEIASRMRPSGANRDQPGTFLLTTREGGRGIVQVFPRTAGFRSYRLRYRMILMDDPKPISTRHRPHREN
jgi:hypothetical protein